jgi:hypothetical protein
MLLCTLLVLSAGVLVAPALAENRAFPFFALGFAAAFLVGMFLVFFLAFGDWRWSLSIPLALVMLITLRDWSPASADFLRALPVWVWPAAALGAWAIFAAWYLRVRQVRPVMLMPPPRTVELGAARPVPRAIAIRTLLASSRPSAVSRRIRYRATLVWVVLVLLMTGLQFVSLTSVFWPLTFMLLYGERSVAIVRQSRLVWLRIPGSRDAVRLEIERVLWRNWVFGAALLAIVAAIAASPLVGAGAPRALLGLAATAGAALYGTYVAMAAVPNVATTYLLAAGPVVLLQVVLLGRPESSLTAVAVVAGVEFAGAALLRALVIRRWRTVDWLRLRPLPMLVGGPRWL